MYLNRTKQSIKLLLTVLPLISYWVDGQSISPSIEIVIRENQIYIPVYINGHGPYQFRLVSGTSETVGIDSRLAKALKLNIVGFQEISEGTQQKRVFLVGIDKLNLGSVAKSNLQVRVGNYNLVPQPVSADGIIGLNFFVNYRLQIDGPANQLAIVQDTTRSRLKSTLVYTRPYLVSGKIGSKEVLVNLDVGSPYTMLLPTTALLGVHYVDRPDSQIIIQANPPYMLQEASITDDIVIGSVHLTNQTIYHSSKVHQITVGIGFLKNHRIQFDQRRKLINLE